MVKGTKHNPLTLREWYFWVYLPQREMQFVTTIRSLRMKCAVLQNRIKWMTQLNKALEDADDTKL